MSTVCRFSNKTVKELFHQMATGGKGQVISKGLFGFFNSPKERTKYSDPDRLGQKLTFSGSFFGRIEETNISF